MQASSRFLKRPVVATLLACSVVVEVVAASADSTRRPAPAAAATSLLRSLSIRDRIAQLIIVRGYGDYPPTADAEYQHFLHSIKTSHVGGFIVAGRIRGGDVVSAQPFEMATFINHMQRIAKTPLLVGSDFERGASMRVAETARFPYLMAFGAARDLAAVKQLGAATAREARALGVNWAFAPDADVNSNPDNPIINTRSFGQDPQTVAANVGAFIDGAHADPGTYVLLSAKHFPGHGDVAQDTHMQLARLDQTRERIESTELTPFRTAIAHGVDSIMTAHMAVPAFEPETKPATVSHKVLTELLREELGFKGLVVTDALDMQAITSMYSPGEAAVHAIEAGADVLLMPSDPDACIRALLEAVVHKRIPLARINASVLRVLAAKQRAGLFRNRIVNVDRISDELEERRLSDLAQNVSDRAFTLLRDSQHMFPLSSREGTCLAVASESEFSTRGSMLVRSLQTAQVPFSTYVAHADMSDSLLNAMANDMASRCKRIYAAAFVAAAANRGSVALQGGLSGFLRNITAGPVPVALISFGSPYLLRDFPGAAASAATFSVASTAEVSAARAILGAIPIGGRLPVSIPPLAAIGAGMDVPMAPKVASNGSE